MVGGLVEGDHVPVADQQRRQLDPATLATRQRAYRRLPVDIGHQPADHVTGPRVTGPLMRAQVTDQGGGHAPVPGKDVLLGEGGHPQSAPAGHPTGVGGQTSGQNPEQTGLAVPVATHDPDPVTLTDSNGDAVEHDLIRVAQRHRLSAE